MNQTMTADHSMQRPKKTSRFRKYFLGMNLTAALVKLPIFTLLIYLSMNPGLEAYLLALSPILKPALLGVALIGWSFSAYELFHDSKYSGSRLADLVFKTFIVTMATASLFVALTLSVTTPILAIVSGVGAILYSAGKTIYHTYKMLSSDNQDSKDHHKIQARTFAFATGVSLVLGVAVGLNKVAHIAMTVVATVTAFAIGAATFAGAWKQMNRDMKQAKPQPEKPPKKALISHLKIYREPSNIQYKRPKIESREQLSTILAQAITKYQDKTKQYGFVKQINLKTNAMMCLKHMVDNPLQGKVDFFKNTYQWNNIQELKAQLIDLYQDVAEAGLFKSFNKFKTNQMQFLFDQTLYNYDKGISSQLQVELAAKPQESI